jgi:hypothetical protein
MSDVKIDVPLNSIPSILEEGRKIVLNEDQAELNAAAVPANHSEWLQHKIETAKQEGGRLAVPELAEQCEEGSIGFDKSRALNEVSVDQALVESCVVYEDALLVSVSRLGMVDGPQLVSALHGDSTLTQVIPPLQLRIEDGSCMGLSVHINTRLHNVLSKHLLDPQVKNNNSRSNAPREFEEKRTGVLNNTGRTNFVKVMAAEVPRRSSLGRPHRGEDGSSEVETTNVDVNEGKANCIVREEADEVLRGEEKGGEGMRMGGVTFLCKLVLVHVFSSTFIFVFVLIHIHLLTLPAPPPPLSLANLPWPSLSMWLTNLFP